MLDERPVHERYDVEPVNAAARRRQSLYVPRKKIFPKRASGRFRQFKWLVMLVTLTIYYVAPWIRWDRGPFAPNQALLVDLANRRFFFASIEIWPQEFYYVAGLLVMAGVGLFLVTSTVGRAWCGYACPQTVWVDLFLVVERAIEGDRNARMKLEAAPWTPDKVVRRVTKHALWILIGVLTGGAWIFYFADAPTLFIQVVTFQAPFVAYFTIGLLTATTYTFGGIMREQVCTYMCPWPRIQGAMLDEYSLTVTYNDWRGEPRSRHTKKALAEGKPVGDCVDCNACVVVCPMGIDIRDGQQLECITCGLCIDACDDVMGKLGRESGLISYATLSDYNENVALALGDEKVIQPARVHDPVTGKLSGAIKHTTWRSIIRPRTVLYFAVFACIGLAMLTVLSLRTTLTVSVLESRNPLYVVLKDGGVRDAYDVKISNMLPERRPAILRIDGFDAARLSTADGAAAANNRIAVMLEPDQVTDLRLYVEAPPGVAPPPGGRFTVVVETTDGRLSAQSETLFKQPEADR